MIVREILKDPLNIIGQFDYFNDFKDTRSFLMRHLAESQDQAEMHTNLLIIAHFDTGYSVWCDSLKG